MDWFLMTLALNQLVQVGLLVFYLWLLYKAASLPKGWRQRTAAVLVVAPFFWFSMGLGLLIFMLIYLFRWLMEQVNRPTEKSG